MYQTNREKIEKYKDVIYKLYTLEGRPKTYIAKLLDVDRSRLTKVILYEWKLEQNKSKRYLKPSNLKFLNKHKKFIKDRLDSDFSVVDIAKELKVKKEYLRETIIKCDDVLSKARDDKNRRMHETANLRKQEIVQEASKRISFKSLEGEEWKDILGYEMYQVSNKGRVRRYLHTYGVYRLMETHINHHNKRGYIVLCKNDGGKGYFLHRLVARAFCDGYTEEKNTVNHKDGNTLNNCADNLEWVSQSENNKHAYRVLGRQKVRKRVYTWKEIKYKKEDKEYTFKTVSAFARFVGKSPTQCRRYIDDVEKYRDIELVY